MPPRPSRPWRCVIQLEQERSAVARVVTRMVLNIAISNTDDHLRNHAAFWDGGTLRLTPAYDVSPQPRSTQLPHPIGLTADGQRASQFRVARSAASEFLIAPNEANEIIDMVVTTIE